MTHKILTGDSAELLKKYPDCHFDAVITDPPYGIEFLGKDWDSNTGAVAVWSECLRVLKPGGYLLAFSAARTYHHLATNIESVGFEIRDQLMWIYASGFPKAQDMGKAIQRRQGVEKTQKRQHNEPSYGGRGDHITQDTSQDVVPTSPEAVKWSGWKTALKPAHEPIVMARKPFKGSTIDNVLQHGVGALNIDASRIAYENKKDLDTYVNNIKGPLERSTATAGANIGMHESKTGFKVQKGTVGEDFHTPEQGRFPSNVIGEVAGYQKYFYCPKVSRRERHCGFDDLPERLCGPGGEQFVQSQDHQRSNANTGNNHPTVKPVALMRYLIQLVTPANSTVLDPFCGSGSTGMAVRELGHTFVGCDLDPHYVAIATRRIEGWISTQGKPAQPTHIPAPFGSVKGCYDQGDGFAARHQQLQQDKDTANTATDKTQPFDRWFE